MIKKPEIHIKGWGKELWVANSDLYCGKILELQKGKRCSVHSHKIKDETFYIIEGEVLMNIYENGYPGDPTVLNMQQGDVLHIPVGMIHEFVGLEDSKIMEVSTEHFETDSYRLKKGD